MPELGEEVWYGLAQNDIRLEATENTASLFENAAQWRDFDIYYEDDSGVGDVAEQTTGLRGRLTGGVINIESLSENIAAVDVYNASGMLVCRAEPDSLTCDIDVRSYGARLFIVRVRLADGTCASLKFVR